MAVGTLAQPLRSGSLDLRGGKAFALKGTSRVTAMVDVFNLLNANPITTFRVVTITLLDPRIVRFGLRVEFQSAEPGRAPPTSLTRFPIASGPERRPLAVPIEPSATDGGHRAPLRA